jgi:very-short-patch-repair endonuclease
MNTTVIKFKTWLQFKQIYSEDDLVKSPHQDDWFSLDKLEEIFLDYEIEVSPNKIKEFNDKSYIKLSDVERLIKTKTNVRDFWVGDLLEIFEIVKVKKTNQISYIYDPKVKLTEQYKFTYTVWKWISAKYPNLEIKIEENFLSRFDIELGSNRGPRVDIVIDSIKIVIEYDELQHEAYENTDKDSIRDKIIQAFGYHVLRFKEKEQKSIFKFVEELDQVIKEQELKEDPKKFASYIIDFFVSQGYRQDIIEKLSQEVIDDIISKVPYDEIGNTPKKIKLSKDIFCWLSVSGSSEKKEITELLIDSIDDSLYKSCSTNTDDYILSPNAFELLLAKLNPEEYPLIDSIRKCYIGIKNKLYHFIYGMYVKLKQDNDSRVKLLKYVNKEGYSRGEKDTDIKVKRLQKTIGKLEKENEYLSKLIVGRLPRTARGLKKINPPNVEHKLVINKSIVSELPELVYTGNQDDYIEEEEVKTIFEINKNKFRTTKSSKKIIEEIKEKLGQEDLSNTLVAGFIFKCKLVYLKEEDVESETESEEESIQLVYANPKTIFKSKQDYDLLLDESDEEEM